MMKIITNLEKISPALAKARARGAKPFNNKSSTPKKLARMVGELRSSSPNPRNWQVSARYAGVATFVRPHEVWSGWEMVTFGVFVLLLVYIVRFYKGKRG